MKKYFIIAAAACAALAACSKVESNEAPLQEVNFEVANYVPQTKATTGVKYENGNFGTYAWFNDTDVFMLNEEVGQTSGKWATIHSTYYWPKSGSITFVSYSPFSGTNNTADSNPAVTLNKITYSGVTVSNVDLMYADKATCSKNVNEIADNLGGGSDSGFTGVPTLFHHALCKVGFKIKANFLTYGTTPDVTTWEVKVTSLKLSGLKTTGDCELNWTSGAWAKPTGEVWQNATGSSTAQELLPSGTAMTLTTSFQDLNSASGLVLPQTLAAATQKLTISYTIKTTLPNGNVINETFTDVALDLASISSLTSWKMNQNIIYEIGLKPTASDDTDPHANDPEDVVITFDPAVADWTTVSAGLTINI